MNILPELFIRGDCLVGEGPGRSGFLSQGFRCDAPVLYQSGNAERNRYHDSLQQAIQLLPIDCTLQVRWWHDSDYADVLDQYERISAPTAFSTKLRSKIISDFRERGRHLRLEHCALNLIHKVSNIKGLSEDAFRASIACGNAWGQQIDRLFGAQGGTVRKISGEDFFRFLARRLNPSFGQRKHFDPIVLHDPTRSVGDSLWLGDIHGNERGFRLDGYFHGVIALSGWSPTSWATQMQALTQFSLPYDITVNIRKTESAPIMAVAQREVDRLRLQYSTRPDERILVAIRKKEERIGRLAEGGVQPLFVEFLVVVRATNSEKLQGALEEIKSAIHGMGATYREATLATTARHFFVRSLDGVSCTSHPGCEIYGEDSFAADFMPVSSSFVGQLKKAEALYPGAHGNVVGIRSFGEVEEGQMPFHQLVLGQNGSGKSVFLEQHLTQTDPYFTRTCIFDSGGSYSKYAEAHGIKPIAARSNGRQTLNPFDTNYGLVSPAQITAVSESLHLMTDGALAAGDSRESMARLNTTVARLYSDHAEEYWRNLSSVDQDRITREAFLLAQYASESDMSLADAFVHFQEWQSTKDFKTESARISSGDVQSFQSEHGDIIRRYVPHAFEPKQHLTLGAAVEFLELFGDEFNLRLSALLRPWCSDGAHGCLFDGPGTVTFDGRVTILEYGGSHGRAAEARTVAAHVALRQFFSRLLIWPRKERKRLIIEELSSFLSIPGAESLVREAMETARKFGCQITTVLQQFSRLQNPALRAALVGNAQSFFIFNPGSSEDLKLLGDELGLSSVAREAIMRYGRPDSSRPYSEFTFFHKDPHFSNLCGTVRCVATNIQSV